MSKRKQSERAHDDGSYVVKKSKKRNIVAFILCVLIAFVIWLYASNIDEKKQTEAMQNVLPSYTATVDAAS